MINAIKLVRETLGCPLRDAIDLADAIKQREERSP